ncbi:hypothetical protein F4809DRAFT_642464 [Biscogniauxia mediterranea]|nr:hypothetical protein F4809DRAFT_642464 [Biscogniauxia mediterranea]
MLLIVLPAHISNTEPMFDVYFTAFKNDLVMGFLFPVPQVQHSGKHHVQSKTASCPTRISYPTNRTSTFRTIHSDQSTSSSDALLTSDSRPGALTQSTHSKGPCASTTAGVPDGRPSTPRRLLGHTYFSVGYSVARSTGQPVQSRQRADPASHDDPHAACTSGHIDLEQRRVARVLRKTGPWGQETFLSENRNRRTVGEASRELCMDA